MNDYNPADYYHPELNPRPVERPYDASRRPLLYTGAGICGFILAGAVGNDPVGMVFAMPAAIFGPRWLWWAITDYQGD